MSKLKNEISSLKDKDVYSLILFVLFKLRDIPQYTTLSELIYVLDKDDFLKLCEYFGGMTIKIPTIEDLEEVLSILKLYESVNIERQDLDATLKSFKCNKAKLEKIKQDYFNIIRIMDNYDITL